MSNKSLKGLTIKIAGDTTDLQKSLDKIDSQSSSLSKELGQINKLLKLDPTNTDLLAQKQKVLAEAISSTEKKLETLREAEKQVQAQFERGEVSEAQYRALQREIIETEQKLGKYKSAAQETAETERKLADGAEYAGKGMDKAGDSSEKAAGKFDAAAVAAAAALATVISLGKESVEAFNEVDEGADNVIRATGATGTAANGLVDSYKKVATQVVGSLDEIGSTVGEVNTRFGYTGKQLEECSTNFLKFAEITGVNSTDAVKAVTRALNDAGIPLSDYKILLDQLAKAGQAAGIDVTTLADGLSKNGATMRAMGFDTAETISLLAQFELSGADATTMLSGMKKAMATWTKSGKDGRQEFAKLVKGVKEGSVSAADTLEVFGTKAGPQLVDAIKSGKFEYSEMLAVLNKSQGTLEDTFNELEDGGYSVQRSFQTLKVKAGDLGEEILESTAPALEELLDYLTEEDVIKRFGSVIKNDIVPTLKNVGGWVKNNGPVIKSTLVGITAALVAYKAATIAADVAQNGLKGAIMATEIAQKALNLAQAATPWGLALTAVTGLTVAMIAYATATQNAQSDVDVLTAEEHKLVEAAEATAKAFDDQKAATDKALGDVTAQMGHTQALADELRALADASGKVNEKDQERVNFILGELNDALGTEYTMVDGVIQKYKDLKKNIDQVIQSKLADALLETANADYVAAVQAKDEALSRVVATEKEYQAQKKKTSEVEAEYIAHKELMDKRSQDGSYINNHYLMEQDNMRLSNLFYNLEDEKKLLTDKENRYTEAAGKYGEYVNTINTYEEAQAAVLAGNTQTAVDLLAKKGGAYVEYSDKVDEETAKVLNTLYREAIDAGIEAERIKKNFENGVEGYTEKMVKEAEQSYQDAMNAYATAYADAEGVGEDLSGGMAKGMENKRPSLLQKARDLVKSVIAAMRKEADSHSPSKKTIAFGEDVGEGPVIGIQRKTKDAKKAATEQVAAIMDAYKAPDVAVQHTFRNISDRQADRYTVNQMTAATANSTVLEQILAAIERGQILTIDGNTLVGATAGKMDSTLGQRRALTARGAL